jgi:DNA-binding transcriptional LysR family regulator
MLSGSMQQSDTAPGVLPNVVPFDGSTNRSRAGSPVCFSHNQLTYFVRVAESGQISRAARALPMAQPALSQAIARLERQLGFKLLERHARGVSVTPAGEIFLTEARAVVRAAEQAAATAQALAG